MSEYTAMPNNMASVSKDYCLISPKQLYVRINQDLDEPIGLTTIYKMVKEKGFPSVKIGGRFYVIENRIEEWLQNMAGKRKE